MSNNPQAGMQALLDAAATLLRVWIAPQGAEGIPSTESQREVLIHKLVVDLRNHCNKALGEQSAVDALKSVLEVGVHDRAGIQALIDKAEGNTNE